MEKKRRSFVACLDEHNVGVVFGGGIGVSIAETSADINGEHREFVGLRFETLDNEYEPGESFKGKEVPKEEGLFVHLLLDDVRSVDAVMENLKILRDRLSERYISA